MATIILTNTQTITAQSSSEKVHTTVARVNVFDIRSSTRDESDSMCFQKHLASRDLPVSFRACVRDEYSTVTVDIRLRLFLATRHVRCTRIQIILARHIDTVTTPKRECIGLGCSPGFIKRHLNVLRKWARFGAAFQVLLKVVDFRGPEKETVIVTKFGVVQHPATGLNPGARRITLSGRRNIVQRTTEGNAKRTVPIR